MSAGFSDGLDFHRKLLATEKAGVRNKMPLVYAVVDVAMRMIIIWSAGIREERFKFESFNITFPFNCQSFIKIFIFQDYIFLHCMIFSSPIHFHPFPYFLYDSVSYLPLFFSKFQNI